jgi:hypothetical protein
MCIKCTQKYFIANILPNIPRDDQGTLYPNSKPVKKLFIRHDNDTVREITSITQISSSSDTASSYTVNYKEYNINTTTNDIE